MKKCFVTLGFILSGIAAQAQWYNADTVSNAGGQISSFMGQDINAGSGVYNTIGSTGAPSMYGVFEHRGQSGTSTNAAFINNGSYDASTNGRDYFYGPGGASGQQEIAGANMPYFAELFLMNGAASQLDITNTNGIRIKTNIAFQNGITTTVRNNTANGAIKLDDNASYSNTVLGDGQHVNGYVSKMGNDAFTFPVGSGTDLRTLSMSAPTTLTDQYAAAWMAGDPGTNGDPSNGNAMHPTTSFTAPIATVSQIGQWDWIAVSGTGNALTITASIPDMSSFGVVASDLRLVGWNGSSWVDLSGGSNASGNTEGSTLSGTMIPGIQAIGIGSISNPLPVIFSSFDVAKEGCKASVKWSTAMEQNNDHFEIERSANGRSFQKIGQVATQNGNSSTEQYYSYMDEHPLPGMNYYRVKQVDVDGKNDYTTVKSIRVDCGESDIKVYPTVTNGTLYVDLPAGYENAELQVYTTLGQILNLPNTGKVRQVGMNSLSFQGLAAAPYILRITNGEDIRIFKVIYRP